MYELKPCPFCGLPAQFYQRSCDIDRDRDAVILWFYVGCVLCNIFPPESDGKLVLNLTKTGELNVLIDDREKAQNAWNRRAADV